MNERDPNVAIVELVAAALGALSEELVLVGGSCVGLLITDRARPPIRQTIDVDLVAEVASVTAYYQGLVPRLRARGFGQSPADEHMCRWKRGDLILDVMPSEESVLGHSTNRWYSEVIRSAQRLTLPSGRRILAATAPVFLATKLEAFYSRGGGDYAHHDMEDIVNLIDGRPTLGAEVDDAPDPLREYLREELEDLLQDLSFVDQLPMHFRTDAAEQARVPTVIARMRRLAGL